MNILYKYATRGRPEWFKETLAKYYDMMTMSSPFHFLITCNSDDDTMNNEGMIQFMKEQPNLDFEFSDFPDKIRAINGGMSNWDRFDEFRWDILVVVSDDMIPVVEGFDKRIIEEMEKHFPDCDGALHFNDGFYGEDRCITLSIMGRKLYDKLGYIYHPDYKSFFCDNEFTDVVRAMGKVVYIDEVIIKHDWKGHEGKDALYKRNTALGRPDEETYKRRKAAGFPR